jgi:cytochrome c oxidase cbb3-type subunit 3
MAAAGLLAIGYADELPLAPVPAPLPFAQRAEGLLLARCTICHSQDLIRQQRLDRARWSAIMQKMVHWGAEASEEERAMLVEYLAARYNPNAPDRPAEEAVAPPEPLRPSEEIAPERPAGVARRGEGIYAHNCQTCHGAGGGGGVGPKLAGNQILRDEPRFWETVQQGRGAMPAWGPVLNVQDIADVGAWLRSLD